MNSENLNHEHFMTRCFQLASGGLGHVAPNPMVGCVVVHNQVIIGEGYHRKFGGPHAEVHAIQAVKDEALLRESTLYVNLEPCAHHGKTPPCTSLILEKKIPRVVVSSLDPHTLVSGRGVNLLREHGVEVITGILEKEHRWLNRRYFKSIEQRRPYVILKWAQTRDGFIDKIRGAHDHKALAISCSESQLRNHIWRSQEQAILIGKQTALADNPALTTRLVEGKNPIRILIDPQIEVPLTHALFNSETPTYVIADQRLKEHLSNDQRHIHYIHYQEDALSQILDFLNQLQIQSVIVEGGAYTHDRFIEQRMWDEARILTSPLYLGEGVRAAQLRHYLHLASEESGTDTLEVFRSIPD